MAMKVVCLSQNEVVVRLESGLLCLYSHAGVYSGNGAEAYALDIVGSDRVQTHSGDTQIYMLKRGKNHPDAVMLYDLPSSVENTIRSLVKQKWGQDVAEVMLAFKAGDAVVDGCYATIQWSSSRPEPTVVGVEEFRITFMTYRIDIPSKGDGYVVFLPIPNMDTGF